MYFLFRFCAVQFAKNVILLFFSILILLPVRMKLASNNYKSFYVWKISTLDTQIVLLSPVPAIVRRQLFRRQFKITTDFRNSQTLFQTFPTNCCYSTHYRLPGFLYFSFKWFETSLKYVCFCLSIFSSNIAFNLKRKYKTS